MILQVGAQDGGRPQVRTILGHPNDCEALGRKWMNPQFNGFECLIFSGWETQNPGKFSLIGYRKPVFWALVHFMTMEKRVTRSGLFRCWMIPHLGLRATSRAVNIWTFNVFESLNGVWDFLRTFWKKYLAGEHLLLKCGISMDSFSYARECDCSCGERQGLPIFERPW